MDNAPDSSFSLLAPGQFEDVLLSAVHSIHEAVLITDFEDNLLFANAGFEKLTGFRKRDLLGTPAYKTLLPKKNWSEMKNRNKKRKTGTSDFYEMEILTRSGDTRRVLARGTPLKNQSGEPIGTVGVMNDIEDLKRMEGLQAYLSMEASSGYDPGNIIGNSKELKHVLKQAKLVASAETAVLVLGETGSGKEMIAHAIHHWSTRREKALIKVNCAATPKDLFESEFFGHKKGSFTGATEDKMGRFELAHKGTLFLDEVGEMPMDQQTKLLRALQEKEIQRLGEAHTRKADVRLVAATNRNLLSEVQAGRFREDLYYRLNVFPMDLPPLRERKVDIVPLAEFFVHEFCIKQGKQPKQLPEESQKQLLNYNWPGNIRELRNVIERSVILSSGQHLKISLLPASTKSVNDDSASTSKEPSAEMTLKELEELEKKIVLNALNASDGKIYGKSGAAHKLGLKPTTLQSRLKKWGLSRQWQ